MTSTYGHETVALESHGPGGSLQWKQHMSGHWSAKGLGGRYDIYPRGVGGYTAYWEQAGTGSQHELGSYDTLGAAFGSARRHADGERRQTDAAESSSDVSKDVARKSVASAYGSGEIESLTGSGNRYTAVLKSGKRLHVVVDGSTGTVIDPDDGHTVATHTVSEAAETKDCGCPHSHPKSVPTEACGGASTEALQGIKVFSNGAGLAFIPNVVRGLLGAPGSKLDAGSVKRLKQELLDLEKSGQISLYPDDGFGRLSESDKRLSIKGPEGTYLAYARIRRETPVANEIVPVVHETTGLVHKSNLVKAMVATYSAGGVDRVFGVIESDREDDVDSNGRPLIYSEHYDLRFYSASVPKELFDSVSSGQVDGRAAYLALSPYFIEETGGQIKRRKSGSVRGRTRGRTLHEANDAGPFATIDRDPKELAKGKALGKAQTPQEIYAIVREPLSKESQEVFLVIPLDLHGEALSRPVEVARGQRDRVSVGMSDVMRPVVATNAKGFVVVHNHPSGHARPSPKDKELTDTIRKHTLPDVVFLDHIVVGTKEFYSFTENKLFKVR